MTGGTEPGAIGLAEEPSTLDEVIDELAMVNEKLRALAPTAYEPRARLRSRRHELRAMAERLRRESPTDRGQLEAELRHLERRREQILAARGEVGRSSSGGGPGGGGMDVSFAQELAWRVDAAQGRAEIEARIRELRRRLGELDDGGDGDEGTDPVP